jgi:hypothetical protein
MRYIGLGVLLTAATVTVVAQGTRGTEPAKPAQATATLDKAAMETALWANEAKVNDAVERHNLPAFKALVADGARSVDSGGPMSALDFEKNFAQYTLEPGWKITNPSVVWADTSTAILIYKWTGTGSFAGQPIPSPVFASTVWSHRGNKWVAVFHQESTAAAGK